MCPSTATNTAFYTMVAGTKAKASEANTNWSVFRGHMIPINPDTVTSSDNLHDLGASDHRWRRIYVADPPYCSTQTANSFWAGPTSGNGDVPAFRAIASSDIRSIQGISVFNFQNFT